MRAGRVNAAPDFESRGIEFEDVQSSEQLTVRIEELVVIDLRVFAEDPLPAGLVIGLRGAALDLIAQGVLALIGVGQVGVIEHDQARGQQQSGQQQRQGNAIQADAGGLEGDEFVIFRHHAERDQHGHQRGQRRELIEEIAGKIDKIVDDIENARCDAARCRRAARKT